MAEEFSPNREIKYSRYLIRLFLILPIDKNEQNIAKNLLLFYLMTFLDVLFQPGILAFYH